MADHCTVFPENWSQYCSTNWYAPKIRKVYIGDCCAKHDINCNTNKFYKCLKEKRIVGTYIITLVAATVCLIRYGRV